MNDIQEALDSLLRLHDRKIRRGIDASTCNTDLDWRRLHEAEEKYEEAYHAFLSTFGEVNS